MASSSIFDNDEEMRGFLRNVEALMRRGQPDVAANILESELYEIAQSGHVVARACINTAQQPIVLDGWNGIADRLDELDRAGRNITAIGLDLCPAHPATAEESESPDPKLEVGFFTDANFRFSSADREQLLEIYEQGSLPWRNGYVDIDDMVTVTGMGPLYRMVIELEASCRADTADEQDADVVTLAGALIALRLHQAILAHIEEPGLPRPLVILLGNNEGFPKFSAPVITHDEFEDMLDAQYEEEGGVTDDAMFASLVLEEPPEFYEPRWSPMHPSHTTGTTLRHQIMANQVMEEPVNDRGVMASFFDKVFRRHA